jgi:hypothetical protein
MPINGLNEFTSFSKNYIEKSALRLLLRYDLILLISTPLKNFIGSTILSLNSPPSFSITPACIAPAQILLS